MQRALPAIGNFGRDMLAVAATNKVIGWMTGAGSSPAEDPAPPPQNGYLYNSGTASSSVTADSVIQSLHVDEAMKDFSAFLLMLDMALAASSSQEEDLSIIARFYSYSDIPFYYKGFLTGLAQCIGMYGHWAGANFEEMATDGKTKVMQATASLQANFFVPEFLKRLPTVYDLFIHCIGSRSFFGGLRGMDFDIMKFNSFQDFQNKCFQFGETNEFMSHDDTAPNQRAELMKASFKGGSKGFNSTSFKREGMELAEAILKFVTDAKGLMQSAQHIFGTSLPMFLRRLKNL